MECSVEGCEELTICRGLCSKHYSRAKYMKELHLHPLTVRPKITARDERQMATLVDEGMPIRVAARKFECSLAAVRRAMRNSEIIDRFFCGDTLAEIGEAYGMSWQMVWHVLREHGLTSSERKRPRHGRDERACWRVATFAGVIEA